MRNPQISSDEDRDESKTFVRRTIAVGVASILLMWWLAESSYNPIGPMLKAAFNAMDPLYKLFL